MSVIDKKKGVTLFQLYFSHWFFPWRILSITQHYQDLRCRRLDTRNVSDARS